MGYSFGLPYEIGAFMAGITIANSPVALYISDALRPLRDFFLVEFFFALGTGFELAALSQIWIPSLVLTTVVVAIKLLIYKLLFKTACDPTGLATEAGVRLRLMSELSLILVVLTFTGATHQLQRCSSGTVRNIDHLCDVIHSGSTSLLYTYRAVQPATSELTIG